METIKKYLTSILFALLCSVVVCYAFFEWNVLRDTPEQDDINELATSSVTLAQQNFQAYLNDFTRNSEGLAEDIRTSIEQGVSSDITLKNALSNYEFWGFIVFKQGERWLWNGFVPSEYSGELLEQSEAAYVSIGSDNNVVYLFSIIPFFVRTGDQVQRYDLYARVKLRQDNIIALGNNQEVNPEDLFTTESQYPVHFSFSELPEDGIIASIPLSTSNSDSIATAYTIESDFDLYKQTLNEKNNLVRALFFALFLIFGGFLIISFTQDLGGWAGLFIQVAAFTMIWLIIKSIYPLIEIEGSQYRMLQQIPLVQYVVNAILAVLICFSMTQFMVQTRRFRLFSDPLRLLITSFFIGISSGIIFYRFLFTTQRVIYTSSVRVMDLELIPDPETLVLYLASSVFFISILIVFGTLYWFILNTTKKQFWTVTIGLVSGFLTFSLIASSILPDHDTHSWILLITGLLFSVLLVFAVFQLRKNPNYSYTSKLRLLLFFSYISVCFIYIAFTKGDMMRQQDRMLNTAKSFSVDEENEIEEITIDLLQTLSFELQNESISLSNTVFDQNVEKLIQPEWLRYTISVQLISPEGAIIGDYTTSLSPPQWSTAYRIGQLKIPYEDEQIRRSNLRPIIRNQPFNASTINANYSAFRRGWIPLYESAESNTQTGWILCSVYKELPQLDRPLRTMISMNEASSWQQTLTATEYVNRAPIRSTITGIPLKIPEPSLLPPSLENIVEIDSIYRTTTAYGSESVNELYIKNGVNSIIRVASKEFSFSQHLFSFLRFFFILVILGLLILLAVSWKQDWHIFGYARRFKDRLIDRFILASLVCLIALVGASYFVLNSQNNDDVQERLFDRLGNLVSNLENEFTNELYAASELQRITSILDVDAALYEDGVLVNSTTSQIFTQNVLPTTVPWDVYKKLMNSESSQELIVVALDGEEMMIGFEPWLNADNQIAGIAAIPTFLKAPKFYERLLTTTSFLLGFYTLIFGVLMLAVGFISSQLTSPLEALRDGLKKISDGNLETTLPVYSEDEIGTLTRAYNMMGKRLLKLQKELAETEREAAWKEMARQVAHEIKNPLTPMKLNLQHLERQIQTTGEKLGEVNPKITKIASSMIEQIDSLNKIASDFSKFAKPLEQDFFPFDLNEVVLSVAELYEQDDSFTLVKETTDRPLNVMGVKEEVRRVLVNLIKNAIEALGEKGTITLTTFTDPQLSNAFVEVTDNGDGITSEDQDRIFVPNFSTKSSGTGLGLAISRKIIEEHDGEITFISTKGQGTSFTIRIPLQKD